jgi:hypothetical protein
MTAAVAVLVVGLAGALVTGFIPSQEMWAPLLVLVAPLLAYMMWPRDQGAIAPPSASKRAA